MCWKCSKRFTSWQERDAHVRDEHKPPKQTEKTFIRTGEEHHLINGIGLELGDKIGFSSKGVVTKITITEGSNIAKVEISVIEDFWNNQRT